jgi:hypothetical protein
MAVAATHAQEGVRAPSTRRFHVRMAWTCFAVGVMGFAPTYWLPLFQGTLSVPPLTHLHAVFFYGWLLLFCYQAMLVADGRTARHREVGVAGVSLATGMFFVGSAMAIQSLRQQEAAGLGAGAREFAIVPISGILVFALLVAAAVLNVRRPDVHKRLMLAATVSTLQAAVGRWFVLLLAPRVAPAGGGPPPTPPLEVTIAPGLVVDLLLVAAMVHDRRTRGRVHAAYWVGGAVVLASQLLRVPLGRTDAWLAMTDWLLALAP